MDKNYTKILSSVKGKSKKWKVEVFVLNRALAPAEKMLYLV